VIVLAAPVRTILRLLPELGEAAADGTLILDLGSTKERIVGAMDRLPPRLFAVGGHPMCGREASGFEAAEAGLFRNRVFVLTPTARSSPAALDRAADLARALGARPVVSHLPFVVAANLVGAVEEGMRGEGANGAQVWGLAASGFRDTTRLAASDVEMMLDILLTNGENIADWMRRYARQFAELADLISDGEEEALRARLARAAARRKELNRTDG
jgi:prephenate dehydrogenase